MQILKAEVTVRQTTVSPDFQAHMVHMNHIGRITHGNRKPSRRD
jgi:hypothetical protein